MSDQGGELLKQRLLETMKGNGTVTANSGEQFAVRYELHVYQDEIPVRTLSDPPTTMPGLKEYRGVIRPVRFFSESGLLLEMQDKRKLTFVFTDMRGTIALSEWIG